jgi:hypothetical protein
LIGGDPHILRNRLPDNFYGIIQLLGVNTLVCSIVTTGIATVRIVRYMYIIFVIPYDKYDIAHNTETIPVEQKQPYDKYDIAQNTGTS